MVEYKERIEKIKEYAYRIQEESYNVIIDTLELNAKSSAVQEFLNAVRHVFNDSIMEEFEFVDEIVESNITDLEVGNVFEGCNRFGRYDFDECTSHIYSFNFGEEVHRLIIKTVDDIIVNIFYDNFSRYEY